jgi:acetolactate synthase-1/2/3 large subunit
MGFGFPAAIGAKVAMQVSGQPDAPVVDVAGDGSLMMVCQEFATAVENEIPVVIALLNNRWLGMVKQWQKLFFGARYSATNLGQVPDFVKVAEAFGAKGEYVERPSEIREALERAIKAGVPYVVDIKTDPEEDILPMVPPPKGLNEMIGGRCPPELVERCG